MDTVNMNAVKGLLLQRFEYIERRILLVIDQLNNEQINWRPNESSNSIANLIAHVSGNINERISKGMNGKDIYRNRDEEFEEMYIAKSELTDMIRRSFHELIETTREMTDEKMMQTQFVITREVTNLDMLIQCATHFSEHMGQILYVGKMLKGDEYKTTTVPKKKAK